MASAADALGHGLDFSSGLACLEDDESLDALVNRADQALYRAKDRGRGGLAESVPGGAPREVFASGLV